VTIIHRQIDTGENDEITYKERKFLSMTTSTKKLSLKDISIIILICPHFIKYKTEQKRLIVGSTIVC